MKKNVVSNYLEISNLISNLITNPVENSIQNSISFRVYNSIVGSVRSIVKKSNLRFASGYSVFYMINKKRMKSIHNYH
jgi:hypothetical protein